MLPNRFPDAGASPEYNTVDGTLWYFQAIGAYIRATGDLSTVRELLYPMLENIVQWHIQGTRYGIRMDEDGLLLAGSPGAQLTWMDAKVGDRVVTPRYGKPVEVQALWFNALRVMDGLARSFGDGKAAAYAGLARKAKTSFNRQFWNAKEGCLYDVIGPEGPDASIRPNQLIALSLAHSMVSAERARSILGVAERELLTPVGLRTLSPSHPSYRGRYEGDMRERDSRYHQGSAWPWLAGPYLSALLRFGKPKNEARAKAEEWLVGFAPRLLDAGLGQACELYDGDSPHRPAGCPAQAWSVAELLRATCLLST
jgi:predicted glycogen debranching enzyme